jgi:hypothetical protein
MDNRLEDKLGMLQKVLLFLNDNQATLSGLLNVIPTITAQIDTGINDILAAAAISEMDLTGYTAAKAESRKKLETLTLKVLRATTSYATLSNNKVLKEKVNYNKSDLERARDNELYTISTLIYNAAVPVQANLASFLVTSTDVSNLQAQMADFLSQLQVPKEKIGIRKTYTEQVKILMVEISSLISEQLDVYMSNLEFDYALLYAQYKTSRSIDQTGSISTTQTVSSNVPPTTTAVVLQSTYDIDRTFVFKNKGLVALQFSLSDDGLLPIGTPIDVPPNATFVRDSSDMAGSGDYLLVSNSATVAGSYEVKADK